MKLKTSELIDRFQSLSNISHDKTTGRIAMAVMCNIKALEELYKATLQNVIMCHLSSENADSDSFIEKMKKVAGNANVDVAAAGKSWDLKNPSECPF